MPILKSSQLIAAIKSSLPSIAQKLHQGYQEQIPVQTGSLRDSQDTVILGDTIRTTWGVNYALYVHEGYSRKDGSNVDGQPWTKPVLESLEAEIVPDASREIQKI